MTKFHCCAIGNCPKKSNNVQLKNWTNTPDWVTGKGSAVFLKPGATKICSTCKQIYKEEHLEASSKQGTRQHPAPPPPASRSRKSATMPEAAASFRAAASTPRAPVLSTGSSAFRSYNLALIAQGLGISRIVGDGNCLFRSVATQVYGDEKHHGIVREKCTDFIALNQEHFQAFVLGGTSVEFDAYVSCMRRFGTWGDHLCVQACAWLYGRNAEIWAYCSQAGAKIYHSTLDSTPGSTAVPVTPLRLSLC